MKQNKEKEFEIKELLKAENVDYINKRKEDINQLKVLKGIFYTLTALALANIIKSIIMHNFSIVSFASLSLPGSITGSYLFTMLVSNEKQELNDYIDNHLNSEKDRISKLHDCTEEKTSELKLT